MEVHELDVRFARNKPFISIQAGRQSLDEGFGGGMEGDTRYSEFRGERTVEDDRTRTEWAREVLRREGRKAWVRRVGKSAFHLTRGAHLQTTPQIWWSCVSIPEKNDYEELWIVHHLFGSR